MATVIRLGTDSGTCRGARPELAKALTAIRPGDTLVVCRRDRLARSLDHLLQIHRLLQERGVFFRSLVETVDTRTPQGQFAFQILGAVAELELALNRERTIAGIRTAHRKGSRSGNPGLRAGDPEAIRKVSEARSRTYLDGLAEGMGLWIRIVRQMRGDRAGRRRPWAEVSAGISARLGAQRGLWSTPEALVRAVKRLVGEGWSSRSFSGLPRGNANPTGCWR